MDKSELREMVSTEISAYIKNNLCDGFDLYAPYVTIKEAKTKKRNKIILKVELQTNT